jgi:hypothetical protein
MLSSERRLEIYEEILSDTDADGDEARITVKGRSAKGGSSELFAGARFQWRQERDTTRTPL